MRKVNLSDADALTALRSGREEGLDYFFHAHYPSLTYYAFQLVRDQFLAEELAGEAFVRLWESRDRLTATGSIKAWLYKTVRHSAIDHLRKGKRAWVSTDGLETPDSIERSALHHMIAAETLRRLVDTLEVLPQKCRNVFRLYYFEGKSHEEIADTLKISPATVRGQKAKALKILKEKAPNLLLLLVFLQ